MLIDRLLRKKIDIKRFLERKPKRLLEKESIGIQIEFNHYQMKYINLLVEIQALTSLPGISTVRATMIAVIVISPDRFENKNKFWSYSMLVRHDRQSDGRSYEKAIIRANAALKTIFIGAAEKALEGDSSFRKYYDQLREKGLDHKAARKSVARKIAAFHLQSCELKNLIKRIMK